MITAALADQVGYVFLAFEGAPESGLGVYGFERRFKHVGMLVVGVMIAVLRPTK